MTAARAERGGEAFLLRLDNFEGPFDLLLQLISKHRLDITEVSLSKVTDEFIAHIRAAGDAWDLDQTSHFIVVAATLLDLKAARLIPSGEVEDLDDLALLEARDLLFARLLQYKAFKEVSVWVAEVLQSQGRQFPRPGGLEPVYAELLPEVVINVSHERFAELAAAALAPAPVDSVSLSHLHAPAVTVREQAQVCVDRLRRSGSMSFRSLVGDSPDRITTVCRFLALLELFREQAVAFEQLAPLGELTIRWTGGDREEMNISDEFDEVPGQEPDDEPGAEAYSTDEDAETTDEQLTAAAQEEQA
ncbi:segregation and condensation protein A [Propionibacteriaceae bacterium Y2011]